MLHDGLLIVYLQRELQYGNTAPTLPDESREQTHVMPQINGIDMHIETQGAGDTLILIHGGLVDSRMWDDHLAPLAEHFHVVRYDLAGFGQSDPHAAAFSYLDDLLLLMSSLNIEHAHLVGLSLGGMVALDFALEYPHRVKKLVLPAASVRGYDYQDAQDWVQAYFSALAAGRKAAVAFWLSHPLFATAKGYPKAYKRMKRMLYDNFNAWNPVSNKPEVIWPEPETIQRLGDLRAPTLVMSGAADTADLRGCADILAATIPNVQRIDYPDAGHHFPMEIPAPFIADLIAFLQDA